MHGNKTKEGDENYKGIRKKITIMKNKIESLLDQDAESCKESQSP